ncbi:MAG: hypothetical protein JST39_01150, partial [Bacteroidetes bacterium]|nr:hypothetical protein [Bacteroidota bacterium]
MNLRIKSKIYWSFLTLVLLFVINAIVSIATLNSNRRLATHLSGIVNPSLESMDDFKKLMLESKMYTTNWVFLRYKEEDKRLLRRLHDSSYSAVKGRLEHFAAEWNNTQWKDSLNHVFAGFEQLLSIEKGIMSSLKEFKDYDDPVIKLQAESTVEEEVLPRTAELMSDLANIDALIQKASIAENERLQESSMRLRALLILLAVTIVFAGLFFSIYMSRIILRPINAVRHMVNDLGKGIVRTSSHQV